MPPKAKIEMTKHRPKPPLRRNRFKNRPFQQLKTLVDLVDIPKIPSPPPGDPPPTDDDPPIDDDSLLNQAMADVTPLADTRPLAAKQAQPRPLLQEMDEDELVLKELDELVHGIGEFSFADTDEYIEASVVDLDQRILRRLRRGEYSYQAHLDLHGLNRAEARARVGEFIRKCSLESKKCVLIIHGRGHGSKDNIPIIKNKLAAWLTRGFIGKRVLAYTSARSYDGGTGAVYVLLRTPGKAP
jgi:DNA-nicking Smr family endonuclease